MDKAALRTHFLQQRNAISADARITYTAQAIAQLALYIDHHPASCIALYHPIKGELSPLGVTALLPDNAYCLPVITNGSMTFHAWHPSIPLQQGAYGIAEPANASPCIPDIVITPLLAVDRQGYRLGYGKGYYDRYFAAHPEVIRIGFGFSLQYNQHIPHEPHDMPLHIGVNEKETTLFNP